MERGAPLTELEKSYEEEHKKHPLSKNQKAKLLAFACTLGNLEYVKFLISKGASPSVSRKQREELGTDVSILPFLAIDFAIKNNHKHIFDYLLSEEVKFKPTTKNFMGLNALHFAAAHGKQDIVEELVEKYKMDHQSLTSLFKEPIYYASQYNHFEVVQYLLKLPRRPSSFNMKESIEYAVTNKNHKMIKLLASYGVVSYSTSFSDPMLDACRISTGVCTSNFSQRCHDVLEKYVKVNINKKRTALYVLVNIILILVNMFFVTYTAAVRPPIRADDDKYLYTVLRVIVIYLEFVVVWFFTVLSWISLFFHIVAESPNVYTVMKYINLQNFSVVKWILRPPVVVELLRKLFNKGYELIVGMYTWILVLQYSSIFCSFDAIQDTFSKLCCEPCAKIFAALFMITFYLILPLVLVFGAIVVFVVFVIYTVLPTCIIGALGIGAVLVKLSQMKYLYDRTIDRWQFLEYLTFFGFLNQVAVTVPVEQILIDNHWATLGEHAPVVKELLYKNLRVFSAEGIVSGWVWGFLSMWTSTSDTIKNMIMLVYDEIVALKKQLSMEMEKGNYECMDDMALRAHNLPWLHIVMKETLPEQDHKYINDVIAQHPLPELPDLKIE